MKPEFSEWGLRILAALHDHRRGGKPLRVSDMRRAAGCSQGQAHNEVERLVALGLVRAVAYGRGRKLYLPSFTFTPAEELPCNDGREMP